MDTVHIALISVVVCLILFAFYFQFKFVGIDARTRDAEKVATKFHNVLEATTVGEDIKKNYQAVQTRLSDLQEENDFNTEDVSTANEEIDHLKKENRLMREYYAKLTEAVKGLPIDGASIPDLTLPEIPRVAPRDDYRGNRYESEDEDEYYAPRQTHRRGGRYPEEEPVPARRAPVRHARGAVPPPRGRREEEREPVRAGRRGRDERRGGGGHRGASRRDEREEPEYAPVAKERRGRGRRHGGYDSDDDFLP